MSISVQTSHDTCEAFSNKRIVDYLIEKVGLKESEARKIARSVRRKIFNKFDDLITSSEIREEVNSQLRNRGFVNEAREHERVGVPVTELRDLIRSHNCDNANLTRNPETVHKFAADRVFKEYALMCLPKELATAHNRGNLHQHDLEYFPARPLNCLQHDLRWFIKEGLKVDGTGDHTSVAGPPNQLATLMNHIGEIMLAGQQNCSGGQSASLWNVFAAPFVEGMKYENLLQCVQMLVFNLNMAYSNRGGQVPFTSLNTEFTVPNFLKEETAYGPGGKTVGTYEDYEEETRLLNRAFTEIMLQGDAIGKPHLFPNSIWVLRDEMMNKEFEEDLLKVHELSSKFSIPYFLNNLPDWTGENSNAMGSMSSDTPILLKIDGKISLEYAGEIFSEKPDTDNIQVLTYDKNKKISWQKIKTIIEKPPAPLYKIRTQNGRVIKVTPNHKIPILNNGEIQYKLSEELSIEDELFEFNMNTKDFEDDSYYEFLGVFLADGYIRRAEATKGKRNSHNIEFHFKNKWKVKELEKILKNLEYKYDITNRKDKTYTMYVREKTVRDEFVKYYDGKDKIFPVEYLEEPTKIANIIKGLCFDATEVKTRKGKTRMFSCSDEKLALGFMLALDFLGIRHAHHVDERYDWKPNYQIRFGHNPLKNKIKEISLLENDKPVYDLEIENNHNYVCGWGNIHIENCRTRLNTNWTGDWEEDTLRTGNLAYVTLNLPRIAYKTNGNKSFYDELDRMLALAEEILLIRREHSLKCLGKHKLLPFLTQKNKDGEQYYKIQNATISFGFVGMDEMLKAMNISDGLLDKEGQKVAGEVLDYMNNYAKNLVDETGYRWTVLQTPAESTAHRFATLDKQHYPDKAIVNGDEGSYYYTNSSHIPVDSNCLLTKKLKIESQYHSKTSGGHISHAYLTEETPEPEALMSLTKKMAKTDLGFFAYTSAFSYCFGCNHLLKGLQEQCGFCGSIDDVEQYSRVTGYLQEVGHRKNSAGGWNEGKKQELKDRYNYKV